MFFLSVPSPLHGTSHRMRSNLSVSEYEERSTDEDEADDEDAKKTFG